MAIKIHLCTELQNLFCKHNVVSLFLKSVFEFEDVPESLSMAL